MSIPDPLHEVPPAPAPPSHERREAAFGVSPRGLEIREPLRATLAVGLCVAGLAGIVAIVSDGFGEGSAKVLVIGLAFALFSATGTAGAKLLILSEGYEFGRVLGVATLTLSTLSFAALVISVAAENGGELTSSLTLATLACAHAALLTLSAKEDDSPAIDALGWTSIVLGAGVALIAIAAITGALADVGEGFGSTMAILVILTTLTAVLPAILRR